MNRSTHIAWNYILVPYFYLSMLQVGNFMSFMLVLGVFIYTTPKPGPFLSLLGIQLALVRSIHLTHALLLLGMVCTARRNAE